MRKKNKAAYSLIELSIVIVIISVLITGALTVSVGSVNNAKNKITQDRLKEVYKAMGNFLIANRRLPCPAAITKIKSVDSDYGNEVGNGTTPNCNGAGVYTSTTHNKLIYGMVPVRALGLPNEMAEDGFGGKIAYLINRDFTKASAVPNPNFSDNPPSFSVADSTSANGGAITINSVSTSTTPLVNNAIISLISYGSNTRGAYNTNSSTRNDRSTNANEMENDINTQSDVASPTAVFDNKVVFSADSSEGFDDIVLFKTRNDFISDFNAMSLIPCNIGSLPTVNNYSSGFGSNSVYYGVTVLATSTCASPNTSIRPSIRCDFYGSWITNIHCP